MHSFSTVLSYVAIHGLHDTVVFWAGTTEVPAYLKSQRLVAKDGQGFARSSIILMHSLRRIMS